MVSPVTFANPFWLLLLPILLLVFWWQRRETVPTASLRMSRWDDFFLTQRTWRLLLHEKLPLFRWMTLILLVFAMARPQKLWQEESVEADGVDIMLAMDISPSMLTKDFQPDRLTVAKRMAISFVDRRPHDRIGLVAFSAEAFTACPLTTDRAVLQQYIHDLEIGKLQDGTAIGMGLATAINRLKDSPAKSKVVILLTDGENNAGYIQPKDAAEIAKTFGIRVYTIGVGNDGMAMVPTQRDPYSGEYYFSLGETHLETDLLEEIAAMTNGKFYRAFNEYQLDQVYSEINQLERTRIEITKIQRSTDYFRPLILMAIALLLLECGLRWGVLRSVTF